MICVLPFTTLAPFLVYIFIFDLYNKSFIVSFLIFMLSCVFLISALVSLSLILGCFLLWSCWISVLCNWPGILFLFMMIIHTYFSFCAFMQFFYIPCVCLILHVIAILCTRPSIWSSTCSILLVNFIPTTVFLNFSNFYPF